MGRTQRLGEGDMKLEKAIDIITGLQKAVVHVQKVLMSHIDQINKLERQNLVRYNYWITKKRLEQIEAKLTALDFRISNLVGRIDIVERMSDEEKTIGYQHLEGRIKALETQLREVGRIAIDLADVASSPR